MTQIPLRLYLRAFPVLLVLSLGWPGTASAYDPNGIQLGFQKIADGLDGPVLVTHAGDRRLFIVEKIGRVRIVKNGVLLSTPFLNLISSVPTAGNQGLLGLAFHPDYARNGRLYVYFTNLAGNTVIAEYHRSSWNPDRAVGPPRILLRVQQPYSPYGHYGGHIAFGPDGYLYIGLGDGGGNGDPDDRAQDLTTLLGKMLRIDVDGTSFGRNYRIPPGNPFVGRAGNDAIWSYGLRNPWRWSFDRATGNLWIGDVGQASWEEIDRSFNGAKGAGRGVNYGWSVMEGRHCFKPPTGCDTTGKVPPLVEYAHRDFDGTSIGCAVTGGYVYRGAAYPVMYGGYFFGDYCSGRVWTVAANAAYPANPVLLSQMPYQISSFGEDAAGDLYLTDYRNGAVYKLVGAPK
jgi:glucose/arabinose dehydrogenase